MSADPAPRRPGGGIAAAGASLGLGWGARAGVLGALACVALVVLVVLLPLMALGAPDGALDASALGLDPIVLDAYLSASARAGELAPGCALRWSVLAGIGRVESNNAGGRVVDEDGSVSPPIIGIPLDGSRGTRAIPDSDGGRFDGDVVWDRAVGPMQFIPSSWRAYGQDANADGTADPHNVYDAALAAVAHLCRSALGDYDDAEILRAGLFAYNHSDAYVETVLRWIEHFERAGPAIAPGAAGYVLPLDASWFDAHPGWLTRPHHDYPASDLGVPVGTPVRAVIGGSVVTVTREDSRCGRGVLVAGADGYEYVYCHASEVLVVSGDPVTTGQVILLSGATGNATGPHLHFGIRRQDGVDLCPQALFVAWYEGRPLSPANAPTSGCTS